MNKKQKKIYAYYCYICNLSSNLELLIKCSDQIA